MDVQVGVMSRAACPQCVERCHSEHGGHMTAVLADRSPLNPAVRHPAASSFLVVLGDHGALRSFVEIPGAFIELNEEQSLHGTVDLEGPNGGVWLVDVHTLAAPAKAKFQGSGWARFATDHNLRAGDSLLFTLVAKSDFTVRVFTVLGVECIPPCSKSSCKPPKRIMRPINIMTELEMNPSSHLLHSSSSRRRFRSARRVYRNDDHQVDEGRWNPRHMRHEGVPSRGMRSVRLPRMVITPNPNQAPECGGDDETFKRLPWFLAGNKFRPHPNFTPSFTYVFAAMGRFLGKLGFPMLVTGRKRHL